MHARHGVLGKGSAPCNARHVAKPHLKKLKQSVNFIGHTQATRLLNFVMPKSYYTEDPSVYTAAFDILVDEWHQLQTEGFQVGNEKWFAICLGMQADLPALAQTGGLTRPSD